MVRMVRMVCMVCMVCMVRMVCMVCMVRMVCMVCMVRVVRMVPGQVRSVRAGARGAAVGVAGAWDEAGAEQAMCACKVRVQLQQQLGVVMQWVN